MSIATLRLHGALLLLGERRIETVHGDFRAISFHDLSSQRPVLALTRGAVTSTPEPLLTRVHSSCVTSELLGGCDCDCAEQLDGALEAIADAGRGVLVYLLQEGRGVGLAAKACDRMIVQASGHQVSTFEAYEQLGLGRDHRGYGAVAAVLALLGIEAPLLLLTNNPEKLEALEREKVRVAATRALERAASPFNSHYLGAKRESGHALSQGLARDAVLPGPVERISPERVDAATSLFRLASYWLPVLRGKRLPGRESARDATWLRLHLYLDLARRGEVVALEWPRECEEGGELPLHCFGESLFDRLPVADAARRSQWHDALECFAAADAGLAIFVPAQAVAGAGESARPGAETLGAIVANHARGRSVRRL